MKNLPSLFAIVLLLLCLPLKAEPRFLYAGGNRTDGLHVVSYQVEGSPITSKALEDRAVKAVEQYKPKAQFDVEFYVGDGPGKVLIANWSRRPNGRVFMTVLKKELVTSEEKESP